MRNAFDVFRCIMFMCMYIRYLSMSHVDRRVYIYIYIYIYIISDQIGDKKILMAYRKSFTSFWLVFSLIEIMINNKNSSSF